MQLWKESVNHLNKTISAIYNGVYSLYKFRLVKCTILALPWSYAVLKVWWYWSSFGIEVLPGLKGDELQNMLFWLGGNWEFLPR